MLSMLLMREITVWTFCHPVANSVNSSSCFLELKCLFLPGRQRLLHSEYIFVTFPFCKCHYFVFYIIIEVTFKRSSTRSKGEMFYFA